jgi:hypothetical protein
MNVPYDLFMKFRLCRLPIILIGLFFLDVPGYSQSKFELSGGAGFPELINFKICYGKNVKIALSQSILPFYEPPLPLGPTSVEIYYHFAGKSKNIVEPSWYLMGGLGIFWPNEGGITDLHEIAFSSYPRIGRTINFSKSSGINIDAGIFIPFFDLNGIIMYPSINVSLFFRLVESNRNQTFKTAQGLSFTNLYCI